MELRLAGEVVASTIADSARPDLAGNGIGDGCHAFEFPMTPEWFERRAELTVVAIGADGTESPLAIRLRRNWLWVVLALGLASFTISYISVSP